MNARRCRSSSRWGYNSAHKCGRRARICEVWLRHAFCTRAWQGLCEVWRWFLNCLHVSFQGDGPPHTHSHCRATELRVSRTVGGFSLHFWLYVTRPIKSWFCISCDTIILARVIYWWLWSWNSPCHRCNYFPFLCCHSAIWPCRWLLTLLNNKFGILNADNNTDI